MRRFIALLLLVLCFSQTEANSQVEKNYFDKSDNCIITSDLKEVESHFKQFKKFTNEAGSELCLGDIHQDWLQIARSVLAMKRIDVDAIERNENDDFTRRAIEEKDWWAYFKQRASNFSVDKNCRQGVVAYVRFFDPGTINLCKPFFKMDVPPQLEVLMHEVRHFDGHGHTTCARGAAKGVRGACDNSITDKGSYAISVQAGVELSFTSQLTSAQRSASEAGAIYLMVNRFNQIPEVKAQNYVYLSNTIGEVWKGLGTKDSVEELELVGQLQEPSYIYSNGSALTVFPLNLENNAYRISSDLNGLISGIGTFAETYNSDTIEERAQYKTFSYLGLGTIVKNNNLITSCTNNSALGSIPFLDEDIKSLVSIEGSPFELTANVLGKSGNIYEINCDISTGKLSTTKLDVQMPREVNSSFTVEGLQYGLTDGGVLTYLDYSVDSKKPTLVPALDKKDVNIWVSAAPINSFEVFNKGEDLLSKSQLAAQ